MTNDELSQGIVRPGVALVFMGAIKTGKVLKEKACKAIDAYLHGRGNKTGKQALKHLAAKKTDRSLFEVDGKLEGFNKYAKKYRVDYSIIYDQSQDKTMLVFQGKDSEMLNQAFKEYTQDVLSKAQPEKVTAEIVEEPFQFRPLELSGRDNLPLLESICRPLELSGTPEQQALTGRPDQQSLGGRSEQPLLSSPAAEDAARLNRTAEKVPEVSRAEVDRESLFAKIHRMEAAQAGGAEAQQAANMETQATDTPRRYAPDGQRTWGGKTPENFTAADTRAFLNDNEKTLAANRPSLFEKIKDIEAAQAGAGKAVEGVSKGGQMAAKGAEMAAQGAGQAAGATASAGATAVADVAVKAATEVAKQTQKLVSSSWDMSR